MMAAIGADAPAPAPAPPREDAPTERQSKAPVKKFDLQKQPNATRRAPEAHRVPPSRTAKDAEAEDSDEDEYLHGADQHEGLAQFINRSRDYEPALPAEVVRYYMREAGAAAAESHSRNCPSSGGSGSGAIEPQVRPTTMATGIGGSCWPSRNTVHHAPLVPAALQKRARIRATVSASRPAMPN